MIKFTEEQINNIISLYVVEKQSTYKIADQYGVSVETILRRLKKNGVTIRELTLSSRKYYINDNYFETIDSEDKAYFLGFMFADGYNNTDKGEARLKLHTKDIEILKLFSEKLQTNKPLRYDRTYIYLAIENNKISTDLARHGCVKAKTHILKFPQLEDKLIRHFIRGYFDGDGCVTWNKKRKSLYFSIVANEKFLTDIQNLLMINVDLSKTKFSQRHKNRNNFIMTMVYGGRFNCQKIFHYLYNDATIYLTRKKKKFEQYE